MQRNGCEKEIKYIKKYNRKLKIFRNAFLIIIALFAVRYGTFFGTRLYMFGGSMLRANKIVEANQGNLYAETKNYNIYHNIYNNGSAMTQSKHYKKDGIDLIEIELYNGTEKDGEVVYEELIPNSKKIMYINGDEIIQKEDGSIVESEKEIKKEDGTTRYTVAFVDDSIVPTFDGERKYAYITHNAKGNQYREHYLLPTWFDTIDFRKIIEITLFAEMRKVNLNGRDCYQIKDEGEEWYFDVKTGLPVVYLNDSEKERVEYDFKFGEVTDENIESPKINGYHVSEIFIGEEGIEKSKEYDFSENGEILNERVFETDENGQLKEIKK